MICVLLFTLSSFFCGLAPSLGLLIFFRVLQGVGGGGLAPVEQAILVDTFPHHKRAAAFALYSMAIVTAPAIGPPLGSWITDNWSWRWIFFINIPIGIVSLILTSRLVFDPPEFTREVEAARKSGKLRIDGLGIFLVALGFACLEVVLDRGQTLDWLESRFIVLFFSVAVLALIAAAIWEWRHPDPVVEIRLLADRNFAIANAYYFLFGFALFGSTVLIPQMLQSLTNATKPLWLHGDRRRLGPRSRRTCNRGSRPIHCEDPAKGWHQTADFRGLCRLCDCHVAIRQH
jgi:MFS transporter, DHA2 family, multidrug resistance protein